MSARISVVYIKVCKGGKSSSINNNPVAAGRFGDFIEVLGGNQSDTVKVSRYPKTKLLGVRRLT